MAIGSTDGVAVTFPVLDNIASSLDNSAQQLHAHAATVGATTVPVEAFGASSSDAQVIEEARLALEAALHSHGDRLTNHSSGVRSAQMGLSGADNHGSSSVGSLPTA